MVVRNVYVDRPPPLQGEPESCSHPLKGKTHCEQNRAMEMECMDQGPHCYNHQLQSRSFPPTSTFSTTDRGTGLKTDSDLEENQTIGEYVREWRRWSKVGGVLLRSDF
jgi:hypothetical protein